MSILRNKWDAMKINRTITSDKGESEKSGYKKQNLSRELKSYGIPWNKCFLGGVNASGVKRTKWNQEALPSLSKRRESTLTSDLTPSPGRLCLCVFSSRWVV